MSLHYVIQTRDRQYTDLFKMALDRGKFDTIRAAVSYATVGGVAVLARLFAETPGTQWNEMNKRWLVGIDWCRSDPPALDQLADLKRSQLRVPDGARLVKTGCQPATTFHPKFFLMDGPDVVAVISGSGNLSSNGMLRGSECGSLFLCHGTAEARSRRLARSGIDDLFVWYEREWARATDYAQIAADYRDVCRKRAREGRLSPTDDDSNDRQPRGLTAIHLQKLRTFDHLWIEAGVLGANLGPGRPGSQLDMKRFSRVFFGAPAVDLPPETEIADLSLVWDGSVYPRQALRFGGNGMDKLNVPPPGDRGEMFYDGKSLLFKRDAPSIFNLTVGDEQMMRQWRGFSRRMGVLLPRFGRREWGLF